MFVKPESKKLLICLLLLVLSTFDPISAQQRKTITIRNVLNIAMENSLDLKSMENQVHSIEINRAQAKADFLPYISANTSSSLRFGQSFDQTVGQLGDQETRTMNGSISAGFNIFNGFGDIAAYRKADLELKAVQASYERSKETIMLDAVSGFLQIMLDTELVTIQRENLEAQQRLLEQVEAFYNAGNRSISDLLQQQASIAQAEYNLISSERNLSVNEQRLIKTLGLHPGDEYNFGFPVTDDSWTEELDFEFNRIYQAAVTNRHDVISQLNQIHASGKQIDIARSGYFPALSLSMSLQSNYSSLSNREFSDQFFEINPNKSVGISLSIPLFDQFRTKNNVEKAKLSVESEKLNEIILKQQIAFEIKQSLLDFESLYKQLLAAEKQKEYAEQALEAEQERYNVGSSTIIELTQTRSRFVESASNEARAKMNLLLQRLVIAYYTGRTEEEILTVFKLL